MSGLLMRRRALESVPAAPSGGGGEPTIVHTVDFETGNLSQIAGVSTSGSGADSWGVTTAPDPVHRGTYSAFLSLVDSSAGDGIRFRVDKNLAGSESAAFGGAGFNLPQDSYFAIWVYIPQYIDMGGDDPWNIFQFKQNYDFSGQNRMNLLDSFTIRDRGAGNPYGITLKSIIHDDGTWSHSNKPTWVYSDPLLPVGQWNHIEWHRVWSDQQDEGVNQVRINDVLVHDVTRRTYMTTALTGDPDWDDFNPERHFQWTFNQYHTGGSGVNHDPNTHTLYFDDGYVAMDDWVGMAGP